LISQKEVVLDEKNDIVTRKGRSADLASGSADTHLLDLILSPKIRFLLIKGEPGTGKTTLALDLLTKYGSGLYISTRSSLEQASAQNQVLGELVQRGLISEPYFARETQTSFNDYRLALPENVIQSILEFSRKTKGRDSLVVLDSWDAFAKIMNPEERQKTEQSMFVISEANKTRLVFVSEIMETSEMDYMADAVLVLQDDLFEGQRVRRAIWKKLRGFEIPQRSYPYTLHGGRFSMIESRLSFTIPPNLNTKPFDGIKHGINSYSTGIADLDSFLGGGLEKGAFVLLELDSKIGSTSHVPIISSIIGNFLANDGCVVSLPSVGITPTIAKSLSSKRFSPEVINSSVRFCHFDNEESDPCFVRLDRTSYDKTVEIFGNVTLSVKGPEKRPCFIFFGMEMMEYVFGSEKLGGIGVALNQELKKSGDIAVCGLKSGSAMTSKVSNSCDIHLKLDQVDGALMLYSVKPPSPIYHVKSDHSEGNIRVKLIPMV